MKRHAFTMIELIFAIVIMAIVIIALPRMMRTNSNALEANINQEAIFVASAVMVQTLSYPWDAHSVDNNGTYDKIVAIPGGSVIYNRHLDKNDTNRSFRIGAVLEPGHRRFHEYNATDANISGLKTSSPNLLCQKDKLFPFINDWASANGYKNIYKAYTNVSYITDTNDTKGVFVFSSKGSQATPTNMKVVTITVKIPGVGKKLKTIVVLRSYTANIGETDSAPRVY